MIHLGTRLIVIVAVAAVLGCGEDGNSGGTAGMGGTPDMDGGSAGAGGVSVCGV